MVFRTLLLLAIMAAAWLYDRQVFPVVAFLAGAAWLTPYIRGRSGQEKALPQVVAKAARWMGYGTSRSHLTSFRVIWRDVWVHVRGGFFGPETHSVELLSLSTAMPAQVPFCFVIRSSQQVVREADLVENSRIPRTSFEYELKRVDLGSGMEAAGNLPDLLTEIVDAELRRELRDGCRRAVSLQQVQFNGSLLTMQFYLSGEATAVDLSLAADLVVRFHLTLEALLANVTFKAPL